MHDRRRPSTPSSKSSIPMFSVSRVDVFQKLTATRDFRRVLVSNFVSGSGQNPTFLRSHQKKFPFRAFGVVCPSGTSPQFWQSGSLNTYRASLQVHANHCTFTEAKRVRPIHPWVLGDPRNFPFFFFLPQVPLNYESRSILGFG